MTVFGLLQVYIVVFQMEEVHEIPKRQVDSTLSSTSVTVALWSIGTIINSRAFIILEFFVRLRNSSQIEYQN